MSNKRKGDCMSVFERAGTRQALKILCFVFSGAIMFLTMFKHSVGFLTVVYWGMVSLYWGTNLLKDAKGEEDDGKI